MEGRCERHSFEPAEDLCRACGYEFCHDCLVYTYGPKKPPYCLKCALTAAGIRSNAAVKPRANAREIKKDLKSRRKEGPATPEMASPVTIDWAVPDDDDPSAEPVEPALDDERGGRRAKRSKAKDHGRSRSKGKVRGRGKKADDAAAPGPQVTDLMPDAPSPATPPPAPTTPAIDPEPSRPALVDPLQPTAHDEPAPPPAPAGPPAEPAAPPAPAAAPAAPSAPAAAADPEPTADPQPTADPEPAPSPVPDHPAPGAPVGPRQVEGPRLIDQAAAPAPFPGPRSGAEPGPPNAGPHLPKRTPGASRASASEPPAAAPPPAAPPPAAPPPAASPLPAPPAAAAPPPPAPARPEAPPAPPVEQQPPGQRPAEQRSVEPLGPDPAKGFWRLMPSSIRAKVDRRHDHEARPTPDPPASSGFDLGPGAPQRVERELKTLAEMRPDELDQRLPDVTDLYDQVSDENTTTW